MAELDLTGHWTGLLSLAIFVIAYILVVFEEATEMRKSKPVMVAAGLIWALIGVGFTLAGDPESAHEAALHVIEEYGELFLFLIVAITFVNTMEERRTFEVLRARLVGLGLGFRALFLLTGILSFFLSAALDNMTTALIMGAVVMAIGRENPRFVAVSCVSLVVAANAGGAFSPFGDITTLMVWQKGKLDFFEFFALFLPSLLNWLVPAAFMVLAVPNLKPTAPPERVFGKPGMIGVVVLFAVAIGLAVSFKNFLNLPPALGMMLGLGFLQMFAYYLSRTGYRRSDSDMVLDSFHQVQRVEWDTLFFFFGIIFATRIVVGYLPGTPTGDEVDGEDVAQVTSSQSHAWPEVYFEGIGWVPFEPTKSLGTPTAFAPASESAGDEDDPEDGPETQAPTPTASAADPLRDPELDADSGGGAAEQAAADPLPLVATGLVVQAVGLLPGLAGLVRRGRLRALARRGHVGAAWRGVQDTAIDLGVDVPASETPRAFGARLVAQHGAPETAVATLVAAIERASYAPAAPVGVAGEPVVERASETKRRDLVGQSTARDASAIRTAMLAALPAHSRYRALLLPRSLVVRPGSSAPASRS